MTDTDSLMFKIDTKDFYEDMKTDSKHYNMSDFDRDLTKEYKDNNNIRVVGKFKDEGGNQI